MHWKVEGRQRIGWQKMRCLGDITDSVDMNLPNSGRAQGPGNLAWAVRGVTKCSTWLGDWTITSWTHAGNECTHKNKKSELGTGILQSLEIRQDGNPNQEVHSVQFSSVQSLSCVWLFATPWIAARQASLSITNSRTSLKLTSIELVMPSRHLILCRPLLLLPPIPPSIRVFSNESTLPMRWPKYWSFSFSIIPSKETPGLISFRMDWLDLLAVQGTLKSLLQHHSSKASILQHSAFFTVQLSHPYMTIGKTIALTRRTFVGKVMSLL